MSENLDKNFFVFLKTIKQFDDFIFKHFIVNENLNMPWLILKPIDTVPDASDKRVVKNCKRCGGENILVSYWNYDLDKNPRFKNNWDGLTSRRFVDQHRVYCQQCHAQDGDLKHKNKIKKPGEAKITFGQYRGRSIDEIYQKDRKYLVWLIDVAKEPLRLNVKRYLDEKLNNLKEQNN